MTQPAHQLAKTITLPGAIALALGICIGAGLLVLTGLAYQQSGNAAIYAWLLDGLVVMPVLAVMAFLGAKHPNADGVAGIVRSAFGKSAGIAVQALVIGTFALGLPGVSIVGGNYFAFLVGGGREIALAASATILVLAGCFNYFGARLSGNIQKIFTFSLLGIVFSVAAAALVLGDRGTGSGIALIHEWRAAWPSLKIVFFAFTGWILVASTVEEYRNPQRDYPLAILVSFAIVFTLYLLVALATQLTLSRGNANLATALVAAILSGLLGGISGKVVALVGVLIVTANLNGSTWAFSRLLMACARNGLVPSRLAEVNPAFQVPTHAVIATTLLFLLVLGLYALHILSLASLFGLAGQNFFILYLLCVLSFIKRVNVLWLRLPAVCLAAFYLFWAGNYGVTLLYPLALMCGSLVVVYFRTRLAGFSRSPRSGAG